MIVLVPVSHSILSFSSVPSVPCILVSILPQVSQLLHAAQISVSKAFCVPCVLLKFLYVQCGLSIVYPKYAIECPIGDRCDDGFIS